MNDIIIDDIPQYDPRLLCPNCGDKTKIQEGYGIIGGGGLGPYTLCGTCGGLISKSFEHTGGN
jgi:hypothetical protein